MSFSTDGISLRLNNTFHTQFKHYKKHPTCALYLSFLFLCNWKEQVINGRLIKKGQFFTTKPALHSLFICKPEKIDNAIRLLKRSGDITIEKFGDLLLITVRDYLRWTESNE